MNALATSFIRATVSRTMSLIWLCPMITNENDTAERALKLREQGLDYKAIAERLGLRPSGLYKILARARKKRADANERQ